MYYCSRGGTLEVPLWNSGTGIQLHWILELIPGLPVLSWELGPNFVTEEAENRDVPLFGSPQNAEIPAPTPGSYFPLMSRFPRISSPKKLKIATSHFSGPLKTLRFQLRPPAHIFP